MAKRSITMNGFVGGINEDVDTADIRSITEDGVNEVPVSDKFFLDFRGKIVASYPTIGTSLPSGITADTANNDKTADDLLIWDNVLYQQDGIYKIAEDINWSGNGDFLSYTPTEGVVNRATGAQSKTYGIDMSITYSREDDVLVFLGKTAQVDREGKGVLFDNSTAALGTPDDPTALAAGTEYLTASSFVRQVIDKNKGDGSGKGILGYQWDRWDRDPSASSNRERGRLINTTLDALSGDGTEKYNSKTDLLIKDSDGNAVDFKDDEVLLGSTIETLDRIEFWRLVETTKPNNSTVSNFVALRGGDVDFDGSDRDGFYGDTYPSLSNKDLAIEIYAPNTNNMGAVFIGAACDTAHMRFNYNNGSGDAKGKIWQIQTTTLLDKGADTEYVRFVLPHESAVYQGANYSDASVRTIYVGYQASGSEKMDNDREHMVMGIKEISFIDTASASADFKDTTYKFWQTGINNKVIESIPKEYSTLYQGAGSNAQMKFYRPDGNNPFFTAGKIYYQKTEEEGAGLTDKLLLGEYDYTKGFKLAAADNFTAWNTSVSPNEVSEKVITMPIVSTFQLESGYPETTETVNALWKTSAVVGRQGYVANCALETNNELITTDTNVLVFSDGGSTILTRGTETWKNAGYTASTGYISIDGTTSNDGIYEVAGLNGTTLNITGSTFTSETITTGRVSIVQYGEYDGSLILKGPVSKSAGFSNAVYIDLEFGGETINVLKSSGDRLLIFSDNALTIINVAQDIEFLEASIDFHGVLKSRQVCSIGEGIAYINDTGVYFFNGENLKPLTLGRLDTLVINKDKCAIGFDQSRSLLWVWIDDNTDGATNNIYYYSFITESWVARTNKWQDLLPDTNIVAATNGYSIYEYTTDAGSSGFKVIGDILSDSTDAGAAKLETGKISMGNIAQNKKFYKVKINIVDPDSSSLILDWSIDGSDFTANTANVTTNGYNEIKLTEKNKGKFIILRLTTATLKASLEIGDISLIWRDRMLR